jgi:hypothetical protein
VQERPTDPRLWRLFDLAGDEAIVVACQCGYGGVSYRAGDLQRERRIPSDTLIHRRKLPLSMANESLVSFIEGCSAQRKNNE